MPRFRLRTAAAVALSALAGCEPAAAASPIDPSALAAAAQSLAARAGAALSPQEKAVLDAMAAFKQAVIDSDTVALKRIWTEGYTFINAQGGLVTRAQRLANFASGATNVAVIDNEREITVRVYGDMAVVQNLSTLRGQFSGQQTDTDLRGTFVWVRREGRWQLVTNQLTPVVR
jgi:ketosteroid isomerase-like protein